MRILLRWEIATIAGCMAAGMIAAGVSPIVLLVLQRLGPGAARAAAALLMIGGGAFAGAALGAAQWRVLRDTFSRDNGRRWISMTAAGVVFAVLLGVMGEAAGGSVEPATSGGPLAIGTILGATLGCFQWTVLRREVRASGWWLASNMLSWGGALAIAAAMITGTSARLADAVALAGLVGAVAGLPNGMTIALLISRLPARGLADADVATTRLERATTGRRATAVTRR